jgi:hypothetical protein
MKGKKLSMQEYNVILRSVRVARTLLRCDKVFLENFSEGKFMNDIVGLLGWPETMTPSLAVSDMPKVFQLQLTCFELLAEAFRWPQNSHRWSAVGGFQKMMDVIFWVASVLLLPGHPLRKL